MVRLLSQTRPIPRSPDSDNKHQASNYVDWRWLAIYPFCFDKFLEKKSPSALEDVSDKICVVAVWSPFEAESEIAARIIGIRGGKVFGNLIYGSFPGFPLKSSKLTISNWPLSCRKSSFERNCRSILPLSSLSLNIKLYVQDVVGGLYRGGLCATKHCDVPLIRPTTANSGSEKSFWHLPHHQHHFYSF